MVDIGHVFRIFLIPISGVLILAIYLYIYIFSFLWLYSHHLPILHCLGHRRHRKPRWPHEMFFFRDKHAKANWNPWSIEIDGLPFFQMGGFSIAMLNYQRVNGGLSNQIMKPTQRWDWQTGFLETRVSWRGNSDSSKIDPLWKGKTMVQGYRNCEKHFHGNIHVLLAVYYGQYPIQHRNMHEGIARVRTMMHSLPPFYDHTNNYQWRTENYCTINVFIHIIVIYIYILR